MPREFTKVFGVGVAFDPVCVEQEVMKITLIKEMKHHHALAGAATA
jgi:hypothetical protein